MDPILWLKATGVSLSGFGGLNKVVYSVYIGDNGKENGNYH